MDPRLAAPQMSHLTFSNGDEFIKFALQAQTPPDETKMNTVNSLYERQLQILTNLVDLLLQKANLPIEARKKKLFATLKTPEVPYVFIIYNLCGRHCIVELGSEIIKNKSAHFMRVYDHESKSLIFTFRIQNDEKYSLLAFQHRLKSKSVEYSSQRIQELANPFALLFNVKEISWGFMVYPAKKFLGQVAAAPALMDISTDQESTEVKAAVDTSTQQFASATEMQSTYSAQTAMQIDQDHSAITPSAALFHAMQPAKHNEAKKRKLSTKEEKLPKKIKFKLGSCTECPIPADDLIHECKKNKDLVWGDRIKAFISHARSSLNVTYSGVNYTGYSVFVALDAGKSIETIRVEYHEAPFARLAAFACDDNVISWFHRFGSKGQLVSQEGKEQSSSKTLKELRFFHNKKRIFTAFATHDPYGEDKENTVHLAVGETQGVHRFDQGGIPSSAILGFFSRSFYKLFGYQYVDLVDASHLPASMDRSKSRVKIIEELSDVVWGIKGRSDHGVRLGIASYLTHRKSGYQRIFEAAGMSCTPRNGKFQTAFDGEYTQSDAERKDALDNLPDLTLQDWYCLLEKQRSEALAALPSERARILTKMRSISEFKKFAANHSPKKSFLNEELADLVKDIAATERNYENILGLCSAYHAYAAEPDNAFKRQTLLIKLRYNKETGEFLRRNMQMRLRNNPNPTTLDELLEKSDILAKFISYLENNTIAARKEIAAAYAFCIDATTGKEEYRDYQALEWAVDLPAALYELARCNLPDMSSATHVEQKSDAKSTPANPFTGSPIKLVDLLNHIKKNSSSSGGEGPNSDYLAFMNLLTHGVHLNKSPSLAPIAPGAMQTVKKRVQALSTNSFFYTIEEKASLEAKTMPSKKLG